MSMYIVTKMTITVTNTVERLTQMLTQVNTMYLVASAYSDEEYTELIQLIKQKIEQLTPKEEPIEA